ncbi:MAG: integrase arm-type DNA-binding domain-containing protein [Chlorobiaceae bacterium]|nr:integrase arm-type DNA-binding domain-containing protein [Chlorobiaceae bacterium]
MPKIAIPLSDTRISKAKPTDKDYKLSDGGGMHLLVTALGSKLWRMQYRFEGKQKTLTLGRYPEITLADARVRRDNARKLLAHGVDPSEEKKALMRSDSTNAETFETVAEEWLDKNLVVWSKRHAETVINRLNRDVFPAFGKMPIHKIRSSDLLTMLLKIEARGAIETAHRVKIICGQIFRYAVSTGKMEYDPAASIRSREVFRKRIVKHHAAITDPDELGTLLRAIDNYSGTFIVCSALRLAPMLFVRPGELRKMEWSEIDLENALWTIPAHKMKMKQAHMVPLSLQALKILNDLLPVSGDCKYVFIGRTTSRPMSNNSINAAMRNLGFDRDTMTGHGFRATARTMLDEILGCRVDLIEHQLAHAVRDSNGRAYNRTSFINDRRIMMQKWSDYLDELR